MAWTLDAVGDRNQLAIPLAAADPISAFLLVYKAKDGRLTQALRLMGESLAAQGPLHWFVGTEEAARIGENLSASPVSSAGVHGFTEPGDAAPAVSREMVVLTATIREALTELDLGREDRLLSAEQTAELLACKPRSAFWHVKPVLRRAVCCLSDVIDLYRRV